MYSQTNKVFTPKKKKEKEGREKRAKSAYPQIQELFQ